MSDANTLKDNTDTLASRLAELETRLAFQEDALQTLSEQLAHQQALTTQQQKMMQWLYEQWQEMHEASTSAGNNELPQEKPPHY